MTRNFTRKTVGGRRSYSKAEDEELSQLSEINLLKRDQELMPGAHHILQPNEPDPTAAGLCALAIMTKAPRAGEVKTRLIPPLTPEEAASLNICFLRDTASAITQITSGARGIACFTPASAGKAYREIMPLDFQLIPQRGETFGARLIHAMEDLLKVGFGSVCLIDSDSPLVAASIFAEAAETLASPNDIVVLGPSDDGGYYLIGLKKAHRRLFEKIEWSTDRVCTQTLARAAELRLDVHLLPSCYDVDNRETLDRLYSDLLGQNSSSNSFAAPATKEFLRGIYPHLASR